MENFLQQQARFDDFTTYYNQQRPHQALEMKVSADLYTRSTRPYTGLGKLRYPMHDRTVTVTQCGRVCYNRQKINLSRALAGRKVGVKQVDDKV